MVTASKQSVKLWPSAKRGANMHLMLDLETGGTQPGCAIFAIGACVFNPYQFENPKHTFYTEISHTSCMEIGLKFEPDTMRWWKGLAPNGNTHIQTACQDFLHWLHGLPQKLQEHISAHWANSPSFDYTILKHVFNIYHYTWPFPYWQERDVRTLKFLAYPNGDHPLNNTHNALNDAINQSELVQQAYLTLGLSHETRNTEHHYQKPNLPIEGI